jgi:hydrogenase maturation protease
MSDRTPLLVLGLGNVLLADDGVGSAAVTELRDRYEPCDGARVLDGGTLGLSLLPYLDQADIVILVDAIRADAPPGSLVRLQATTWARPWRRACRRIRSALPTCSTARAGSIAIPQM